ncbi:conjugal transfer mating pair stabilization protein TraN [compost metagenome]
MQLAKFLLGATCALFTLAASAQPAAPSAADIARAKAAATQTATQMRNLSIVRDGNGEATRDANGSLQTTQTSRVTQQGDLDYFKSITGLEGLEQVATPGRGQAGIAKVTSTQTFDLDCRRAASGLIRAAGGLTFRLGNCSSSPVRTIQFTVCDAAQRVSQCAQPADFSRSVNVPVGSFVAVGNLQVGAGCNSADTCRISVKGTETLGGNDTTLKQQAQQATANSGIVSDLGTKVADGTYSEKMNEVGRPLMDCAERNRRSMGANGKVTGCGDEGQQAAVTVNPANTQQGAQCNTQRTCLRWGTTSQTYSRSCTRTFPLTERVIKYQYETAECRIVETTAKDGTVSRTNSCVSGDADAAAGMNKIGDTSKECTSRDAEGSCVAKAWTEYFASKDPEVLSVNDSPSPVAGACDNSPLSETRYTGYEGGTWFGRTLPDNECISQIVDEGDGASTGMFVQLTNTEKAGCGVYTTPSVGTTCYGQPSETDDVDSCRQVDLSGCQLVSATPGSYTGGTSGLIMSQQETFQCSRSQNICLEWSKGPDDAACMDSSQMTFGTDQTKTLANDGSGMNAALVAAAIIDATAEGVGTQGGDKDPFVPLLFSGDNMKCTRATGGIGQLFGRNCCRMDLERPVKGNIIRGGCDLDDVRLAAARRSHYTVYIGDYCSKKMKFPSRCLERTESYCTFNGVLPRLLHEQGRAQLASMAASSSGASVIRNNLTFPYFDSDSGHWSPPLQVNGVTVTAWKWPSYCVDPAQAAEHFASNPDALECPGVVRTVIATCDNGNCGDLPRAPEYGAGEWSLIEVNPLERATTAVSRYAVVTGACSTTNGNCTYEVAAWPAGQGGKAVITRDISWELFSNQGPTSSAPGGVSQMSNMADLMFRTWSQPGMSDGKTVPAQVRIDFSRDGGQSWRTVNVPTDLTGREYEFPDSDTRMTGKCDALTNLCAFRVTGTLTIWAKPWGSAKRPDCTGFTAGQLSAMDFGKMDLSEWLATVMDKAANAAPTELAKAASQQFSDFNSLFQEGQGVIKMAAPNGANFARVSPSQGFGPFDVQLVVSGYWPQTTGDRTRDTDVVTRVEVDWGDCTGKQVLSHIPRAQTGEDDNGRPIYAPTQSGDGYVGMHRFESPDKLRCGSKRANVTQVIEITAYTTKSGVQKRTVSVENAWAVFPGAGGGNNDNVPLEVSAPVNQGAPVHPNPR